MADEASFVLGRDPATVAIKEILDSIRGARNGREAKKEVDERLVDEILLDVDQAATKSLEGKTLQDLVLLLEAPLHDTAGFNDSQTTA